MSSVICQKQCNSLSIQGTLDSPVIKSCTVKTRNRSTGKILFPMANKNYFPPESVGFIFSWSSSDTSLPLLWWRPWMGIREVLGLFRLSRAVPLSELPSLSLLDWATLTAIFFCCFWGKRLMPLSLVIFFDAMWRSLSAMDSPKLNTPTNSSRWKIRTTSHSVNYTLCCLNYNNLYLSLGNLQNGHLKILLQITAMIEENEVISLQQFRHKDF